MPNSTKNTQEETNIEATATRHNPNEDIGLKFSTRKSNNRLFTCIKSIDGIFANSPLMPGDEVISINNISCVGRPMVFAEKTLNEATGKITRVIVKPVNESGATQVTRMKSKPDADAGITFTNTSEDDMPRVGIESIDPNGLFANSLFAVGDEIISINTLSCIGQSSVFADEIIQNSPHRVTIVVKGTKDTSNLDTKQSEEISEMKILNEQVHTELGADNFKKDKNSKSSSKDAAKQIRSPSASVHKPAKSRSEGTSTSSHSQSCSYNSYSLDAPPKKYRIRRKKKSFFTKRRILHISILAVLIIGAGTLFLLKRLRQIPTGDIMKGMKEDGLYGGSISLSSMGERMAVGGHMTVHIYSNMDSQWTQEADLSPFVTGDYSLSVGKVVLSSDGSHLIVGDADYSDNDLNTGAVLVFTQENEQWAQVGQTLVGERNDFFGKSIDISDDGTRIVIAAKSGYVKMYDLVESQWEEMMMFMFGTSVAMAQDGAVVAIGDPNKNEGLGIISVYDLYTGEQIDRIDGHKDKLVPGLGDPISFSSDGSTIASGYRPASDTSLVSFVGVFRLDQDDYTYKEYGQQIIGFPLSRFGQSLSLSTDGDTIAIGAPREKHVDGMRKGRAYIYKMKNRKWRKKRIFEGVFRNDSFGKSISMSDDGKRLVIGSPQIDRLETGNGYVTTIDI